MFPEPVSTRLSQALPMGELLKDDESSNLFTQMPASDFYGTFPGMNRGAKRRTPAFACRRRLSNRANPEFFHGSGDYLCYLGRLLASRF